LGDCGKVETCVHNCPNQYIKAEPPILVSHSISGCWSIQNATFKPLSKLTLKKEKRMDPPIKDGRFDIALAYHIGHSAYYFSGRMAAVKKQPL
jgi:hypothetical protein